MEQIHTMRLAQLLSRFYRDARGQDVVEYALIAGFVAVAAGALVPNVSSSISAIFSKFTSAAALIARY
jgi:Flp pilus assembly pilin Flp